MSIDSDLLRKIVEGALMAAGKPLSVKQIMQLFRPSEAGELEFEEQELPSKEEILAVLEDIQNDNSDRGFELKEVGSGWRFQVVQQVAPWVTRLWEEKPQRYSRALLETLALIAYRQPITRGDIESIRGVAVSSNIIRTLMERDWVKIVGHRDVPGRPALYATTKEFLDYFNLKSLDELPSLKDIKDLDKLADEFDFEVNESNLASQDAESQSDDESEGNQTEMSVTQGETGSDEKTESDQATASEAGAGLELTLSSEEEMSR